ncbi:PREDICTED: MATH domain and coiled-coil domain-containing protein At2g42480-like [Camelina sativa]|uniref:MATH domain and coiled-coil domain-containing protein At2g42480-like n=1 Tax=Camelina sativa TaxID=90675 RepID=A0ABM1RNX8_CAMSA|nr:PREDICTED: MATH domain and coiled-coil domain-containing protein At2g42480-like [Camelina sativa]
MWNQKPCYRFEIDNFSEKESAMVSNVFVSGGYEWYISLYPYGEDFTCDDDLSLYLTATNSKSMGSGWKRIANCYFVLLNQSDKVLYRSRVLEQMSFQADCLFWGLEEILPLSKFLDDWFLEDDKLIVEVYIQMVESFDGERGDVPEKKETVNGFEVLASQAVAARKIFSEHPDLAYDFRPKNQVVRTEYMNVLLNLVETLYKPSQDHSETDLRNAQIELSELAEAGFKLDWLKSKLDEVSLKRKRAGTDERFVYAELTTLNAKLDCLKTKLEEVSLEKKKSDDADGSRVKEMEGRIDSLEAMVSDLKVELGKEKAKSSATDDFLLII